MIVERMEIGDFVDDDLDAVIERKRVDDLSASIQDGRVYEQAIAMRDNYKHAYIIQVGTYEQIRLDKYQKNMSINRFIGALTDLAIIYQVPVLQCENLAQYARYVDSMFRKIDKEPPTRKERRKQKIKTNQTLSCLLGLNGVGEKRAHMILKQFPTIHDICHASTDDLSTIKGLGMKKAKEIKKVLS